jgi:heme/copper-type cytochrome/quinol oxidase subunit 2
MEDIEAFSTTYRARLDEAELAKTITENITLEVVVFPIYFFAFLFFFRGRLTSQTSPQ